MPWAPSGLKMTMIQMENAAIAATARRDWASGAIAAFSTWIMVIFKPDGAHGMYSWPHVLLATAVALFAWRTMNRPAAEAQPA